jgi:hypothetical protein
MNFQIFLPLKIDSLVGLKQAHGKRCLKSRILPN